MAYKKHEGYLDPTSGQAMQNTHWEELQQFCNSSRTLSSPL